MFGTLKRLLILVVLVGVAYGGFRWGPRVFPPIERALGIDGEGASVETGPVPTPELAESTLDRFEQFRAGEAGSRLVLGANELTSLVRYAVPGIMPRGVTDPTIEIRDGRVHLSARVAMSSFPELPRLDQVIGFLPDTVSLELRGSLVPIDRAVLALVVDRIQAGKIPLPSRMVADVLAGLGRESRAQIPANALPVPYPDGLGSVFLEGDSLVLMAERVGGSAGGEGG